jgi:hypothetical protein
MLLVAYTPIERTSAATSSTKSNNNLVGLRSP